MIGVMVGVILTLIMHSWSGWFDQLLACSSERLGIQGAEAMMLCSRMLQVDMWAVGVLLYYLLSGTTPFNASSVDAILARVKAGKWSFSSPAWATVSRGAKDLIQGLLQV
jgi:serine/threonine protein kinase